MRYAVILAAVLASACGGGAELAPGEGIAFVGACRPIDFGGEGGCAYDIYVVKTDGTELRRLAEGRNPAWSPDGTRIAFVLDTEEPGSRAGDLYVIKADGSGRTWLTDDDSVPLHTPAWSPDGSLIAFASYREGNSEIYVADADGSAEARITNSPENETFPAWSPAGDLIAFSSHDGVYTVRSDGSGRTRLAATTPTLSGVGEIKPVWSPDGSRIAFASSRGGITEMHVVNMDGSASTRVATGYGVPAWSPDGQLIAYISDGDIWAIKADGSSPTRLTVGAADALLDAGSPWSPDGTRISYYGRNGLTVVNADGSGTTIIVEEQGLSALHGLAWSPRRLGIAPATQSTAGTGLVPGS